MMNSKTLVFCITGESYSRVFHYRQAMDLRIVKNQIERRGMAIIHHFRGQDGLGTIHEIPEVGEAIPWYSTFGQGYNFTVRPEVEGAALKVKSLVSGFPLICTEILPSLELLLPEGYHYQEAVDSLDKSLLWTPPPSFMENQERCEIELRIPIELLVPLAAWKNWGEPLTQYEFIFAPSSVRCEVIIQHAASGEHFNLIQKPLG